MYPIVGNKLCFYSTMFNFLISLLYFYFNMQYDLLVSSTLINRQDQMLYNPRWCKSNHGSGKIKSIGMIMYSPHYKASEDTSTRVNAAEIWAYPPQLMIVARCLSFCDVEN